MSFHCQRLLLASTTSVALLLTTPTLQAQESELQEIPILEEIVVTAEKRYTELQKTPQLVNVVSGETLSAASITDVRDLQTVVPNLSARRNGSGTAYTVRGISAQAAQPSDQPSVAVLVDGIYSLSTIAGSGSLFDVAQVEVLKGPQGTLFGRNATAGVLNIRTQKPKFETSGQIGADVGDFSKTNINGLINFAVTDQLAVRASLQSSQHDGYYKDGFDDESIKSGRVKLLYAPNEKISLMLTANYVAQEGIGSSSTVVDHTTGKSVDGDPWSGPTAPSNIAILGAGYQGLYGANAKVNNESWGINPELEWTMGPATLTAIGSYQESTRDDVTANYNANIFATKEKSLEVRLASSDNAARLRWLGGIYYYDYALSGDLVTSVSGLNPGASGTIVSSARPGDFDSTKLAGATASYGTVDNSTKNYAVFTQETFAIVDRVRLTGGARWQSEKAQQGATRSTNISTATTSTRIPSSITWHAVTWKAGVDMDVTENSMAYVTVSTGWKAGAPLEFDPPYDQQKPEKLTAYTLGSKNRFMSERLQLNGEVFYWDYRDRQYQSAVTDAKRGGAPTGSTCIHIPVPPPNGQDICVQPVGLNAVKSHVQGADLEFAYALTISDLVSLNVEYLDKAVHDDLGKQTVNGCSANCQMSNAPKWSGTASYSHTFDMGDRGRAVFDLRSKLQSQTLLEIAASTQLQTQKRYTMSSAGLSYSPQSNSWNARAYVNNIENALVKTNVVDFTTYGLAEYQSPRTYGVQLRANFK